MNKKTINTLQFVCFLGFGIFLVYMFLRQVGYDQLVERMRNGNYLVCIAVYIVSLAGYWFRVTRWHLFYEPLELRPRKSMMFASLCISYLVMFALPRVGEIARALILKKSDNVPVMKSVYTVVAERITDGLSLLLVLLLAFFVHAGHIRTFFTYSVFEPLLRMAQSKLFIIVAGMLLIGILAVGFYFFKKSRKSPEWLNDNLNALKSVFMIKKKGQFALLTFLIWFCYFLMTYLWLFVFDDSAMLGWKEALVVMAVGSIARSLPIQGGGMGAYHFLVGQAFVLFGLSLVTGSALAFIIHGAQVMFTFFTGTVCYAWFLMKMKKQNFVPQPSS